MDEISPDRAMLAGNVATEDLVYLLSGLGIEHGIDMDRLLDASQFISRRVGPATSFASGARNACKACRTGGNCGCSLELILPVANERH